MKAAAEGRCRTAPTNGAARSSRVSKVAVVARGRPGQRTFEQQVERIEGQVQAHMLEKWDEWERTQPVWFDEAFKARVPDNMIPEKALAKLTSKHGGI